MRGKALLLSSVSMVATATGVAAAHAGSAPAPSPTDGFIYSVDGGALFSKADTSAYDDKAASAASAGKGGVVNLTPFATDVGYTAGFTVGKQIDPVWDVTFGARINKLLDNNASVTQSAFTGGSGFSGSSGMSSTFSSNFAFETGDFEVGYRPELGGDMKVRLFGGIRALHFQENLTETGSVYSSYSGLGGSGKGGEAVTAATTYDFLGAGPRLGFSMAKRFEGSPFGISGQLAGAVIFGRQTTTTNGTESFYSSYSGGVSTSSHSVSAPFQSGSTETKTLVDVEGNIGVDYYLTDNTTLTAGYHAESLSGVPGFESDSTTKLVHGPFMKLTGGF